MKNLLIASAATLALVTVGASVAHAAPSANPTDIVVAGGTNTREIVVTLDNANQGLDSVSIQLVGATWNNVAAAPPTVAEVSTNPNTFTDCGTSGVSVKTATATSDYECALLGGVDAILYNPGNETNAVFGATATFRIAPGAIKFSSSMPAGGYAIRAIVTGFGGLPIYRTDLVLSTDNSAPNPSPEPSPNSNSASGSATVTALAHTGGRDTFITSAGLALFLVLTGGAAFLAWRRKA